MADKKISQLTSATTPLTGTEVLPIVQSGSTVKVAVSDLTAGRTVDANKVTIGGGSNVQPLTVNGNGNIYASASATWYTGGDLYIRAGTSGNLRLGANNTNDYAYLTSSGYFVVGNTAAAGASQITAYNASNGQIAVQNSTNWSRILQNAGDLYIDNGVGGSAGNIIFRRSSGTTESARIDTNGNWYVEVAATTASAANMFLDTTTTPTGQVKLSTSALKYKQDIRDLEDIDITSFRPVRYKSACEGDDQTVDHFGFIADWEDEAGHKELVSYGKDGKVQGFQYDRMTVVLAKVVQKQDALIRQLLTRVAKLES